MWFHLLARSSLPRNPRKIILFVLRFFTSFDSKAIEGEKGRRNVDNSSWGSCVAKSLFFARPETEENIFVFLSPPPFIYHNFYLRKLAIVVLINLINSLIDFRLTFLCFRAQKANKFPRDFALRCVFFIMKQSRRKREWRTVEQKTMAWWQI